MMWYISSSLMLWFKLNYFILHNFFHFLDVTLVTYSLYPLQVYGIPLTRCKYLRAFWPNSVTSKSLKVIDNLWKVHGIIYGFNKSRRQIDSGVKKNGRWVNECHGFCTTSKGYLPNYSYNFRKMGPLRTETKNGDCSMSGTVLDLDTQGEGGYEDIYLSKIYWRDCSVH